MGKESKSAAIAPRDCMAMVPTLGVPRRTLGMVIVSPQELSAFEFFFAETAQSLSLFLDADFLIRLAVKMSGVESSVRHAMMAVGALHRQHEYSAPTVPATALSQKSSSAVDAPFAPINADFNDPFVMAQYNQAIAHLFARLQDLESTVELTLASCMLFVMIEFIRGNMAHATRHFIAGRNIAVTSMQDVSSPAAVTRAALIKDAMLPFLNRVELFFAQSGHETHESTTVIELQETGPAQNYGFVSVEQARDSAVLLMNSALKFVRHIKRKKKYAQSVVDDDFALQSRIRHKLEYWIENVEQLVNVHRLSQSNLDALNVVRLHEIVTRVSLCTCISDEEIRYDQYFSDYDTAVVLCESVEESVTRKSKRTQEHTFLLFNMEVVSQLYHVGTKCRHPLLRRRAIALLRRTFRQEGVWDSYMAANIAQRIMELEEIHTAVLDGSQLPPEQDRIRDAKVVRSLDGKTEVTFYSLPEGPLGKRRVWKETIVQSPNASISRVSLRVAPGKT